MTQATGSITLSALSGGQVATGISGSGSISGTMQVGQTPTLNLPSLTGQTPVATTVDVVTDQGAVLASGTFAAPPTIPAISSGLIGRKLHGVFAAWGLGTIHGEEPVAISPWTDTITAVSTAEPADYVVTSNAELATVMAYSDATLSGKTIALAPGDYTWTSSQFAGRSFSSLVRVISRYRDNRATFNVAGNGTLYAPKNLRFEDLNFYCPFVVGVSNPETAAITINGPVNNFHLLRCSSYSNLGALIPLYGSHIMKSYRGFWGSDGSTNLTGPHSFISCEFHDLGRVLNLRIGGTGSFEFLGNIIHDFGNDAAIFSGRPASAKLMFNLVHTAIVEQIVQFPVTAVDVDNNRITIQTDELGVVGKTLVINVGTNTTTPPGGLNLPGYGGANDYHPTIYAVSGGQTTLQFSEDITSAGTNVWLNIEPGHADGFQFIPGSVGGGDCSGYEIAFNDMFITAREDVTWPQGIFMEDVSSDKAEGHYNGITLALNRLWCGAYNGIYIANPIDCLVAGNSLIQPHNGPAIPKLTMSSSWYWGGHDNLLLENVAPIIGYTSGVTGADVGNIIANQTNYASAGVFAGTGGYQPTTLAEFQAAFARTDIVGTWDMAAHTYDVPMINSATIPAISAVTGAVAGAMQTSAAMQITGILNGQGVASSYGGLVSVYGGISPQFRITSDALGASVVADWSSTPHVITAGQYLWVRDTAANVAGAGSTVTVRVGKATKSWSITTAAAVGFSRVAVTTVSSYVDVDLTALGVQAGDVVICAFSRASNTSRPPTLTGYTQIGSNLFANSTNDTNLSVWYKVMGATPDATVHSTTSGSADGQVFEVQVWRGVDNVTPIDVTQTTATGLNSRVANPAAITPVTAGAKILCFAAAAHTGGDSVSMSASYLSGAKSTQHTGTTYTVSTVTGWVDWTGGAYDPAAVTIDGSATGDSWAAMTIALRPAA